MKYLCLLMLLIFIQGCSSSTTVSNDLNGVKKITSFEECVKAGNPVARSYPAQCHTKDGQVFWQKTK